MSKGDTIAGAASSNKSPDDRLRFIKHKGHPVFLIDLSRCSAKEMILLLDQVRADVARHAPGSVLILADFRGQTLTRALRPR